MIEQNPESAHRTAIAQTQADETDPGARVAVEAVRTRLTAASEQEAAKSIARRKEAFPEKTTAVIDVVEDEPKPARRGRKAE